jgi:hypothetical protein
MFDFLNKEVDSLSFKSGPYDNKALRRKERRERRVGGQRRVGYVIHIYQYQYQQAMRRKKPSAANIQGAGIPRKSNPPKKYSVNTRD